MHTFTIVFPGKKFISGEILSVLLDEELRNEFHSMGPNFELDPKTNKAVGVVIRAWDTLFLPKKLWGAPIKIESGLIDLAQSYRDLTFFVWRRRRSIWKLFMPGWRHFDFNDPVNGALIKSALLNIKDHIRAKISMHG